MLQLYLARHGQTQENVAEILQGHMPGQLTPQGRRQAEALREQLVQQGVRPDVLIVSDLKRTLDTAKLVNEAYGLPVVPCKLLRERDWGPLTGQPVALARGMAQLPCGVESVEQMMERAQTFLAYLWQHYNGMQVLAIGHGLFGRCILAAHAGCNLQQIERLQNAEVRHVCISQMPLQGQEIWTDSVSAD